MLDTDNLIHANSQQIYSVTVTEQYKNMIIEIVSEHKQSKNTVQTIKMTKRPNSQLIQVTSSPITAFIMFCFSHLWGIKIIKVSRIVPAHSTQSEQKHLSLNSLPNHLTQVQILRQPPPNHPFLKSLEAPCGWLFPALPQVIKSTLFNYNVFLMVFGWRALTNPFTR